MEDLGLGGKGGKHKRNDCAHANELAHFQSVNECVIQALSLAAGIIADVGSCVQNCMGIFRIHTDLISFRSRFAIKKEACVTATAQLVP